MTEWKVFFNLIIIKNMGMEEQEISELAINSRGELIYNCMTNIDGFQIIGLFTWSDYYVTKHHNNWKNLNKVEFLTLSNEGFVI
jgi:hypothetical protein